MSYVNSPAPPGIYHHNSRSEEQKRRRQIYNMWKSRVCCRIKNTHTHTEREREREKHIYLLCNLNKKEKRWFIFFLSSLCSYLPINYKPLEMSLLPKRVAGICWIFLLDKIVNTLCACMPLWVYFWLPQNIIGSRERD